MGNHFFNMGKSLFFEDYLWLISFLIIEKKTKHLNLNLKRFMES